MVIGKIGKIIMIHLGCGGYPNDKLSSYRETLDFIEKFEKKNNCKIDVYINPITREDSLKTFWEKYPNGAMSFV